MSTKSIQRRSSLWRLSREKAWIEPTFVVVTFLVALGVVLPGSLAGGSTSDASLTPQDPMQKYLWFAIRAGVVGLVWRDIKPIWILMSKNVYVPLLVGLTLASTAWSPTHGNTLKQTVYIAMCALFGYYVVARFSRADIVQFLMIAVGIALALSVVLLVVLPGDARYSNEIDGHAMRGVFQAKNPFGRCASMGVILFGLRAFSVRSWSCAFVAVVSVWLLLAASSATALLATIIVLACVVAGYQVKRGNADLVIVIGCVVLGLLIVAIEHGFSPWSFVLGSVGRDDTLTGRSQFWPQVIVAIKSRPWLGYGTAGFWRGFDGPGSGAIWASSLWHPGHAHNGFFDLALDTGMVGVGLLIAAMSVIARQSWAVFRVQRNAFDLWPLFYLAYIMTESFTESVLVKPTSLYWILFVVAAASASRRQLVRPKGSVHRSLVSA